MLGQATENVHENKDKLYDYLTYLHEKHSVYLQENEKVTNSIETFNVCASWIRMGCIPLPQTEPGQFARRTCSQSIK